MLELTLVLNALWFASAFHLFYLRRAVFAKLIVDRAHRDTPAYDTLVESGRFLGGFNLAFAVLNALLLLNLATFDQPQQWAILLFVNAVAHGSQFVGNVPIALQNRRGKGVWVVMKGLMRWIFIIDFSLMTLNALLAANAFWGLI